MADFHNLKVWQKSMELTEEIYRLVRAFPREETYALSDQMRRAAVSVPSNIAEGYARNSDKEFLHFLSIANGSSAELQTQLEISVRLGYLEKEKVSDAEALCRDVGRMLTTLRQRIR